MEKSVGPFGTHLWLPSNMYIYVYDMYIYIYIYV